MIKNISFSFTLLIFLFFHIYSEASFSLQSDEMAIYQIEKINNSNIVLLVLQDAQYLSANISSFKYIFNIISSINIWLLGYIALLSVFAAIAAILFINYKKRKKIEKALVYSEENLRSLFDGVPIGIFRSSAEGELIDANPALIKILGFQDNESLDEKKVSFFCKNSPVCKEWHNLLNKENEAYNYETEITRADGLKIMVELNGRVVKDSEGKVLYYQGNLADISQKKKAEEKLKESERKLSTLMSNLQGMAYRCKNDPYWTMEFVSAGCFDLTGYKSEDLVNNKKIKFIDLKFTEDVEHDREVIHDALKHKETFNLIYRIKTAKTGKIKWVWEQGCGVFDNKGNLQAIEGFIADITDRKKIEEEIVQLNTELEQRVLNRTQELHNTLIKLQEDEKAGRKIQCRLLPEDNVKYGSYEFSSYFQPSMYLSGDFIDYFKINENHLGFYMADVSGHGVSSAFITVFLKSFFAQHLKSYNNKDDNSILNTSLVIEQLNNELILNDFDKYLTIFYAVIDIKNNKLRCSNGGQFPFPIFYDGNNCKFLTLKSNPVGLFEEAMFESRSIDLPEKFSLFLISDGILEILRQKTLNEKKVYLLSLINSLNVSISDIRKEIKLDMRDEIPDDITFLNIKKTN
ncbi:MAG: PAS domain S-box protein [Calditrichia bacterium]|nr:PAS domain S-box protein [Calditrichia bacterium]